MKNFTKYDQSKLTISDFVELEQKHYNDRQKKIRRKQGNKREHKDKGQK